MLGGDHLSLWISTLQKTCDLNSERASTFTIQRTKRGVKWKRGPRSSISINIVKHYRKWLSAIILSRAGVTIYINDQNYDQFET